MGKGPKASEFKPSAAEQASAAVAQAQNAYFKKKYDPLLQRMRDESLSEDNTNLLRGRANADVMQSLSRVKMYDQVSQGGNAGDMAQAFSSQQQLANKQGLDIKNKKQLGVLGVAQGQAGDAQSGMAKAADLGTSRGLAKAEANQTKRLAKWGAAGQIGSALVLQGAKNMGTKGTKAAKNPDGSDRIDTATGKPIMEDVSGGFFSPVDKQGNNISGLGNRWNWSQGD